MNDMNTKPDEMLLKVLTGANLFFLEKEEVIKTGYNAPIEEKPDMKTKAKPKAKSVAGGKHIKHKPTVKYNVTAVEVGKNKNAKKLDSKWTVEIEDEWDEEDNFQPEKLPNCITKFFDFYTLSLLNYFAGSNSLNHSNRVRRIEETYEQTVEDMYNEVRRALEYSVIREFRHFNDQAMLHESKQYPKGMYTRIKSVSKDCLHLYDSGALRVYLEKGKRPEDITNKLISDIFYGYREFCWDEAYGGKLWGDATEFLFQHPRNAKEKELWVDKVLDLHHNNGHLLNKTKFNYLSNTGDDETYAWDGRFTNARIKHRKTKIEADSALDYRRYAHTISDLSLYASTKVQNLSTANLNYIPAAVR
jgi:hypothetical protein